MKYDKDLRKAKSQYKPVRESLTQLRKKRPKDLDDRFHNNHEEVFSEIECLECANCCKTTSPIIQMADIERLSRTLKMKVNEVIDEYLQIDEDHDYVFKTAPCPFLGFDNKCIVYKNRPKACREYPHTNRKNMYQIMNLTARNTLVCPAVSRIVDSILKEDKLL